MKDQINENDELKLIIEGLVEILIDLMQPISKKFYYNFIVLKYDIFPIFKSHITIACDPKKKKKYNRIFDSNIDQMIEEEQFIISDEIQNILKYSYRYNYSDQFLKEINDLVLEFAEKCRQYSNSKRKNKAKY